MKLKVGFAGLVLILAIFGVGGAVTWANAAGRSQPAVALDDWQSFMREERWSTETRTGLVPVSQVGECAKSLFDAEAPDDLVAVNRGPVYRYESGRLVQTDRCGFMSEFVWTNAVIAAGHRAPDELANQKLVLVEAGPVPSPGEIRPLLRLVWTGSL